jgi:hypothetical protein
VIQHVLPLHECVDHALAEFATEHLHSVTDSAAAKEAAADPASSGTALTQTFCLCVQV